MTLKRRYAFAILAACASIATAAPLPQLLIDPATITVSGLSAGGYMANQLGIAYSSTFKGVGVFAGGPYRCAGHASYTSCMYNASISAARLATMQADIDNGSGTSIDPKANLANQRVFLFVGNADSTVGPNPMNALNAQYQNNGVPPANLQYVRRDGTAHVFPTDFAAGGNNACGSTASPYIANCGYDGAKAVLEKLYGPLQPRNDAPAAGNYLEFDQTAFTNNPGMAATGWAYVPAECASGSTCKLHLALHGCKQDTASVGQAFVRNTGYTRWADTNRIVVLFPQTRADSTARPTAASGSLPNLNACWDWVGWYGNDFARKSGTQARVLKAMVDHVAGGGGGGGSPLPAPAGVATSGATNTGMTIAWGAVNGAVGYNVYRGGAKVNASPVGGTSFADTGLAPGTTYSWTVKAVDANGAESAASAPATGTTTGSAATCTTASNYAHTTAGRAYALYGYAYAKGSNQNLGLWNVYVTTTLKQTGPNHYVLGTCP